MAELDHASRAALDPVRLLEAGEDRQLRLSLDGPLPPAKSLPGVARGHVGVSHRHNGGQEIGLGAQRLAKPGVGGLPLAFRDKRPPELVSDAGQCCLLVAPVPRAKGNDTLLRAQRPLPLPAGDAQLPQRSERGQRHVPGPIGRDRHADEPGVQRGKVRDGSAEGERE